MRTTEEEGVWKGHSSAFFSSPSSLLLRIQTLPIFLAEVGDGASSHDLPRSRNAAQPSLHSGLEGMTIISALYMYVPYITSVSPSSFLLFAMSECVCVCVFLSAPDAAALPCIQCTLQTVSSDGFFCAL